MKKKIIALLCMAALTCALLTGCGGKEEQAGAEQETVTETGSEEEAEPEETTGPEESAESEAEAGPEESAESEETAEPSVVLEDGVYTADFNTSHGMFHVNEAYDGKGTLTVENGQMTIHVSLVSKNIVNLFCGLSEDAQKDGAELIEPTIDEVTYSDGFTEEVYGFDIPVPALDEEFDVAIIGTKGKWYDHKVSVSNPEKAE